MKTDFKFKLSLSLLPGTHGQLTSPHTDWTQLGHWYWDGRVIYNVWRPESELGRRDWDAGSDAELFYQIECCIHDRNKTRLDHVGPAEERDFSFLKTRNCQSL